MPASASTYNSLAVAAAALGSFTYGFNSSIIGSIFGLPGFFAYFGLTLQGAESAPIVGAANGLFAGGGLIGCIIVPWVSDKLGRIRAMQIACALIVVSAAIQSASVHIGMFLVGRFICGVGTGIINTTVPLYQSEISPPKSRGRMVASHGIGLVTGYSMAAYSGLGCYFEPREQVQWRLLLALQCVAPGILACVSPWVPESPRWLIMNGKEERALKVLRRLHPQRPGTDHDFAASEYAQISQEVEANPEARNIFKLLKSPSIRKRFGMGIFIHFITQSTGILVVNNYQILLWQNVGLKGYMPLLLYAIYLTWASFLNVVSSLIVDKVGRVRMLIIGMCGLICMLSVFTGLFATYAGTDSKGGQVACIVALFLWLTFYATCVDAVSFIYCAEIFPTQMRSQGVAASTGTLFAMTLLLTQVAATAFAEVGWKFYLTFIIVPLCGLPVLWTFPETKGLSLEEIAVLFGDGAIDAALESDGEKLEQAKMVETVEDSTRPTKV